MQRCPRLHALRLRTVSVFFSTMLCMAVVVHAEPGSSAPQSATPLLGACQNRQTALWGLCRVDGSAAPPVVAQRFAFIGAAGGGADTDRFPARLHAGDPAGFLDSLGNWAIKPKYTQARPYSEGLAVVSDGDRSAAIDRTGNIVVPWFNGLMYPFSQGLACVVPEGSIRLGLAGRVRQQFFSKPGEDIYGSPWWQIKGRVGFVDTAGRMAIAPRFEPKLNFLTGGCGFGPAGYAAMREDGKEGLIDRQGEWVVAPEYEYLGMVFSGNRKVVALIADRRIEAGLFLDTMERLDGSMVPGQPVRWRETGPLKEAAVSGGLGRALLNQMLFPRWQQQLLNDDVSSHTLAAWVGSVFLSLAAAAAIFRRMRRTNLVLRVIVALTGGAATLAFTFLAGVITLYSTAVFVLLTFGMLIRSYRHKKTRRAAV